MSNQINQILMIAYYFPPLGGAGVQRSSKFAKYLARQGWQVRVVS
ncbi:MAG TPA: glycosyl transferase family 1, partial [Firmicutes bacterium]|nr:glycosyl transferase family 1 [Bacillota bacterium]